MQRQLTRPLFYYLLRFNLTGLRNVLNILHGVGQIESIVLLLFFPPRHFRMTRVRAVTVRVWNCDVSAKGYESITTSHWPSPPVCIHSVVCWRVWNWCEEHVLSCILPSDSLSAVWLAYKDTKTKYWEVLSKWELLKLIYLKMWANQLLVLYFNFLRWCLFYCGHVGVKSTDGLMSTFCRCSTLTLWMGRTCCWLEKSSGALLWRRMHKASSRWLRPHTMILDCEMDIDTTNTRTHTLTLVC